jgi:hypothetical protein
MEVYRELYLRMDPDQMAAVADQIERSPPQGWARDRAAEARLRAVPEPHSPTYCFTCAARRARPAATLFLMAEDEATFKVLNVLRPSGEPLTRRQYNAIVEDFYRRVLRPLMGSGGVRASLTAVQAELEHWLSAEAAESLRRFSAWANKKTGSAHPADRERWHDFLLRAHQSDSPMTAPELGRWLLEVGEWSDERAEQLVLEYEFGRELLAHADRQRRRVGPA